MQIEICITLFHASDHLGQIWNIKQKSTKNSRCYRTDTTKCVNCLTVFAAKSWSNDLEETKIKVVVRDNPSVDSYDLCKIWKESIQNCMSCRTDTTWCTILEQFMAEWSSGHRPRSKVSTRSTFCMIPMINKCWVHSKPPLKRTQVARFMGPTWGPPVSCRPQMGPMLAPLTLLSGNVHWQHLLHALKEVDVAIPESDCRFDVCGHTREQIRYPVPLIAQKYVVVFIIDVVTVTLGTTYSAIPL